jgi:hypothetical protein
MQDAGFVAPASPNQVMPGPPKTGYLILPHNSTSGCLENACLDACSQAIELACADAFIKCVGANQNNSNLIAKMKTRTIIAACYPGKTLGQSALTGIWDKNAPPLKIIEDFISLLQ